MSAGLADAGGAGETGVWGGAAVSTTVHRGAAGGGSRAPLWWAIVRLAGWGAVSLGVSLWFTARVLASLTVTLLRTRGAEAAFGRALGQAGLPAEAVARLTDIYGGPIRRVRQLVRIGTWLRRARG